VLSFLKSFQVMNRFPYSLGSSFLLALLVAAPSLEAAVQTVESTSPGHISVRAEGQPLDELLLELNTVIDFDMLLVDRKVEKRPVTVSIVNELVEDALWEILDAAKVNGIVWGREGEPYRLFAGSPNEFKSPGRRVRSLLEEAPPSAQAPARQTKPNDQDRPRRATGPARAPRTATGNASLGSVPERIRWVQLGAILGSGMLMGLGLVGRDIWPTR